MGGHAFSARRAFDLATYGTAEAVPFHNCANLRVFPKPACVMSRNFVAKVRRRHSGRSGELMYYQSAVGILRGLKAPQDDSRREMTASER